MSAPSPQPTVLHVDINSYFATILQQENPHLRGRPLGVVKEAGRTCLIAVSKEAKRLGIKTGTSLNEARQLCPTLLTLPASFDHYLATTRRLHRLFQTISPEVIIYSLDEAFLDISHCQRWLYPSALKLGKEIQQKIKAELGEWVTCNVGIGPNRFLAKLTSEVSTKGSVRAVDLKYLDAFLTSVKFADVCGIGPRLAQKLKRWHITNLFQLRFFAESELARLVGPHWARELLKMAWGREPHLLALLDRPAQPQQSIGRSLTTFQPLTQMAEVETLLCNLAEEVAFKARVLGLVGRRVGVELTAAHATRFHPSQKERPPASPVWRAHQLYQEPIRHGVDLLEKIKTDLLPRWREPFAVIRVAVWLEKTQPLLGAPLPLWRRWHQWERLSLASDAINTKYGLFTLRPASLGRTPARPEVTGFFSDQDFWLYQE